MMRFDGGGVSLVKNGEITTLEEAMAKLTNVAKALARVLVGQELLIRQILAAVTAGGHVLLQDVPGTGKTTLAVSLAKTLGLEFRRVQGTPDLLPGDLLGTMVYHPGKGDFSFRPGPIFTELLLLDEVNRATPRTQSALLEAMGEGQVSVDGETHVLPNPFFVIATANPLELQGVFPLPEAQLDRFMVQLHPAVLTADQEVSMLQQNRLHTPIIPKVGVTPADVFQITRLVRTVRVMVDVLRYVVSLGRASREHPAVVWGASPRALIHLVAYAQALALLSGRDYVIPDDVQEAWLPVMNHRLQTKILWQDRGQESEPKRVLTEILANVPVPTEFLPSGEG